MFVTSYELHQVMLSNDQDRTEKSVWTLKNVNRIKKKQTALIFCRLQRVLIDAKQTNFTFVCGN